MGKRKRSGKVDRLTSYVNLTAAPPMVSSPV